MPESRLLRICEVEPEWLSYSTTIRVGAAAEPPDESIALTRRRSHRDVPERIELCAVNVPPCAVAIQWAIERPLAQVRGRRGRQAGGVESGGMRVQGETKVGFP
jgi:hypothetical protein